MSAQLEVIERARQELTPADMRDAITHEKEMRDLLKSYYASEMQAGYHYYSLKAKDRPTLSKAGSLNLCSLFKVTPFPAILKDSFDEDKHLHCEFRTELVSNRTGEIVAVGFGSCSTREKRFGSNKPADGYNACIKMAEKRSIVDATCKLPLVSELFTQDSEPEAQTIPADSAARPINKEQYEKIGELIKLLVDMKYWPSLEVAGEKVKEATGKNRKELNFDEASDLILKLRARKSTVEAKINTKPEETTAPKADTTKTDNERVTMFQMSRIQSLFKACIDRKIFRDKQDAWTQFLDFYPSHKSLDTLSHEEATGLIKLLEDMSEKAKTPTEKEFDKV